MGSLAAAWRLGEGLKPLTITLRLTPSGSKLVNAMQQDHFHAILQLGGRRSLTIDATPEKPSRKLSTSTLIWKLRE